MATRMNVTVPTKYTKKGSDEESTQFTNVGSAFLNEKDGEITSISVKLNFPVGATELVLLPPKDKE